MFALCCPPSRLSVLALPRYGFSFVIRHMTLYKSGIETVRLFKVKMYCLIMDGARGFGAPYVSHICANSVQSNK